MKIGTAEYPLCLIPFALFDSLDINLNNLYGFAADKFPIKKLIGKITNLVEYSELFGQCANADRTPADNPVVAKVTKGDRFGTGICVRHILGHKYLLAQDGIVTITPEVIPGAIFEGTQGKSCFIVHEPDSVFAVLRLYRKIVVKPLALAMGI